MAEVKPTASADSASGERRPGTGFELRLERGGASVRLAGAPVAPGLVVDALSIEVPGVRFPFNVGAGAVQFRHVLADLVRLELTATADWIAEALRGIDLAPLGLEALSCALRDGFVELSGRLAGGAPFTLHASLLPEGAQGIAAVFHAPRLYGPSPAPAALLPHLAARAFAPFAGAPGGPADPLPRLLRRVLAPRGWKVPRSSALRLASLAVAPDGIRAAWDREPGPPIEPPAQSDLFTAIEGARAFAAAEALLARGDLVAARDAWLAAGREAHAHPFAAERLLSLLCLDERFHDEALDLAHDWLGRRPDFAPALCAEAWVRGARGEAARAAHALSALAASAGARGEEGSALAAADACFALPGADPADVRVAVDAALAARRDHLPALRALRAVSLATGDREGQLRANRRLVAYAAADADKARAHAELGTLLLRTDPPAARLHLDQALRLAPDDEESLRALAGACAAAGEHLRAVRALERLRERLLARGERAEAGRLALEAGTLWEERLGSVENAFLRYGEAAEQLPGSAEAHARAAAAAERLGRWADATDHHEAVLGLADGRTADGRALLARTRLALAQVADARLGDPARAAAHLEAAAAAQPGDPAVLGRLVEIHRRLDRPAELLAAIDRFVPHVPVAAERAALLAEAGALAARLGQADAARGRFSAAAALDPACRPALEGTARLAAEAGDALAEREALQRLLPMAASPEESAGLQERIAGAAERAGDLAGAGRAIAAARRLAPSPARLDLALRLARRSEDRVAQAELLAELARDRHAGGDPAAAARAWLERAHLLADADPALAMAAASEAHALAPGEPSVLRAQADLAERLGDARAALGTLRALLATAPDDVGALEVRAGRAALGAAELAAAREHAERAMAAAAPGATELLAAILDRVGDDAGRAALLERMGRHLEAAELWARGRDEARERQALERAAAKPGVPPHAVERLAELRAAAGDAAGAGALLRGLAPLQGGRAGALLALRAWALDGDPASLDAAVACDPALAEPRAERALLRADADPPAALADAEAALAASELPAVRRVALLRLAARIAEATGDEPLARRRLAELCDAEPGDGDALARLASLQRRAGDPALAATLERRLAIAGGGEAGALRLELGALLAARPGREEEAIGHLRRALEAGEAEREALDALLRPPLGERLPSGERIALLARLAAHPATPPSEAAAAHRERAARLAEGGEPRAALAAARAAAPLAPEPDDALELRAALAEQAGELAEATEARLERARRLAAAEGPAAAARLAEAGLAARAAGLEEAGEAALREALALGLDPGPAAAAFAALSEGARRRADAGAELAALSGLAPLLPEDRRPAALARLSALLEEAGRIEEARGAAREARLLSPGDAEAVERCRALAEAAGDRAEVVELLAALAPLRPDRAPGLDLERARLLAGFDRHAEADEAYGAALAALPPDLDLAREHAALRGASADLRAHPPSEPLERFAARAEDPHVAAAALREAAAAALAADDADTALRCARAAWARSGEDAAFAGPLLARIAWLHGTRAEALALHRALHEAGYPGADEDEAVALGRRLAELAGEAGDGPLQRAALEAVLRLRPGDLDAALRRFALDPDRPAAAQALADLGRGLPSDDDRARALSRAAVAALRELRDPERSERWFLEARAAAAGTPALSLEVERARVEALRAAGAEPDRLREALHEAADAARGAGEPAAARDLLEEAVSEARGLGLRAEAARDLLALADLDAAAGLGTSAAIRALDAGALLEEAGDLDAAAEALRRAHREDPGSEPVAEALERVARAMGPDGAALLEEVLALRADLAAPGPERAAALARAAEPLLDGDPARAARLLEQARAEAPGAAAVEAALEDAWRRLDRTGDVAALLLDRAARAPDAEARARLTREAAGLLTASAAEGDRARAAAAWGAVFAADPADLGAARAAADLLVALGRRDEALPLLAAIVRADPDDDGAAAALAEAFAGRHAELAELHLARAGHATGEARARRLRDAASALLASGDDGRARQVLRDAFDAWPADDKAFFAAIRDAAADIDRLDQVLAARAGAVPGEAAGCHRARADALLAFGRPDAALAAWEACAAANPGDVELLASWAACLAQVHGDAAAAALDLRVVEAAQLSPGEVSSALEAPARYRLGLAAWREGRPGDGAAHLEAALAAAPDDPSAGLALTALAQARAAGGDVEGALDAAARRADLARAQERPAELRLALEAGVELVDQLGATGARAAGLLDGLIALLAEEGSAAEALAPLARRAADAWRAAGDEAAAEASLARAGIAPEPAAAPEAAAPEAAVGAATGLDALAALVDAGPGAPGWEEAASTLEAQHLAAGDFRAAARIEAMRAEAAADPAERARAWLRSAQALERAQAAREEVDAALEIAAEADPDSAEPWLARAEVERRRGDLLAAARAHLSVSIRAEGAIASRSALEAAHLFERLERHDDAARAYRAAVLAAPGCVPARRVLAEEALAAGDAAAAAEHLLAIPVEEVEPEARPEHRRTLGRALEAAGRAGEAEAQWGALFRDAPADAEAFDRVGRQRLAAGGLDAWLELAAEHEAALAARGDGERRRDLRHERGTRFAGAGRLEAARGAFLAALELDPGHLPSLDALAGLDGRREEWLRAADELGAEAERAADGAEAAALLVRRARILDERLGDATGAVAALDEALVRARLSDAPAAERIAVEAEEHLAILAPARPAAAPPVEAPPEAPRAAADAVEVVLRAQAEQADGEARALRFEQLATHLEHAGDRAGAADALLEALAADPERELTWSWLRALVEGDEDRLARAAALRIHAGLEPMDQGAPPPAPPALDLDWGAAGGADSLRLEPHAAPPAAEAEAEAPFLFEPAPGVAPVPPAPEPPPALPTAWAEPPATPASPAAELDRAGAARAALVARWDASPAEQAALRRELGLALAEAGEGAPPSPALLGANAADPSDAAIVEELARLHERAGKPVEALGWHERAADLLAEGPERAVRLAEIARAAERLGDRERAVWLWERVRAADHRYRSALEALCRLYAEAGDRAQLRLVAAELADVAGDGALEPWAAPLGRAWLDAGKPEVAYAWLQRALRADPTDLTVVRDLSRIAERIGSWGEYVRLGEVCADGIAAHDPLAAAARLRHFAEVLRDRLSDTERAAVMLEKALSLTPDDLEARRELLGLWSSRPETAQKALDGWLDAVRLEPGDARALVSLAEACRALARERSAGADALLLERARIAASLAAFVDPALSTAPPMRLASAVPEELRERVAVPGANGPVARLLALLSPWLEPLFPADLARRGVGPADRLVAPRAPALRGALEAAARAFAARPHAVFLSSRAGAEIAVENTQPPSLVVDAEAAALPEPTLAYLAGRSLDLLGRGWALTGKFAPRDVAILVELAARFAGAKVPTQGLPPERAEAFLAALGRAVPPTVRERALRLAPGVTEELATFDARRYVSALRRTANRVALLYAGDPGAALRALALAERRTPQAEVDPREAIARPDLRDLALFALSEPFVELRVAVVG